MLFTQNLNALDNYPLLRAADIDDAEHKISQRISPHRIEMAGHKDLLDVSFRGVHLDGVALMRAYYGCSIAAKPEESEFYYSHTMIQGNSEIRHGNSRCDTIAGDTVVLSPSVPYNMHLHEKCDRIVMRIDPNRVKRHLQQILNSEVDENLVFDLKVENRHAWWSTIDYVLGQIGNNPDVLSSKGLQRCYAKLIIANLVELHSHNYLEQINRPADTMVCPQIKMAVDFIHARVKDNISIREVAVHCSVSTRTLQRNFIRHLEKSPAAYIRDVKLDVIHDEFMGVDVDERGSIKRILLDYGILDFGRFAKYYRQRFGCTPKETINRRKSEQAYINRAPIN